MIDAKTMFQFASPKTSIEFLIYLLLKNKFFLCSQYYAEACNEWRDSIFEDLKVPQQSSSPVNFCCCFCLLVLFLFIVTVIFAVVENK